ncbi:hypothetical protein [Nocardia sp. NPDC057668]|uniref:hypothetical protein n=1 Tax=Nocardia sp. NPDC057668 TaxID=3346202 RepID=UPI003671877C
MARLLDSWHSRGPAIATVGALAAILIVPVIVDHMVPTRETPVSKGDTITLGAGGVGAISGGVDPANAITFAVPEAMARIATGSDSTAVFRSEIGEQRLAISVVDGITDFDTAAPRMLLPLRAAGEEVDFDGGLIEDGSFRGRTCVLPGTAGAVCAVVNSGDIGVTITVSGPTREAGRAMIDMVLASTKAVEL